MIKDIVEFLTPGQEPIQITFFSIITLGVALSILLVSFKANAKSWQRKWEGEALDASPTGLEVEHGSISELSQAVSTPAEKLASMMPGLLLIIGLLGTFLGLGLALDKASSILQSSGSSVGAMDDSMQNLMAMMQGLGTKFKTSTWGIIAFILLKIWESWSGFEERRLTWCINKMKGELGQARDLREQEKLASEEKQHDSLMGSTQLIVDALRAQTEGLRVEMAKQNVRALQMGERRHKDWLENFEAVVQGFAGLKVSNQELAEQAAARDASHFEAVVQGVAGLQASNQELAEQAAARDASHFEAVVQGVAGLQASNQELAEQAAARDASHFEAVVQGVAGLQASNQELAEQAAAHDASFIKAIEPLGDIASFTGQSNQLLADFTGKSRENQLALQQAGETMGTAAQQVATAASSLEAVVDNLSREMSEVLQSVKTDLNGVMTGMNKDFTRNLSGMANQMEGATNKLADIMESVKADLGGTIQIMSDGFKQNMVGMAGDLRQATDNISTSISGMSETVNTAMEEVAKNIENASKIQKATSLQFSDMSAGLSQSVVVMTANMDAIGKRMDDGLESVASNTQKIGGLAKKFTVIADSIETLPTTLQQVAEGVEKSSANVSCGLEQVVGILSQSDRYSSAAEAILKMPGSIDELTSRLALPRNELLQMQKSLTQLVAVANGIKDRVQDFKPAEDLQEA
ncbi:hypothetical protein [Pseudomonas sp. PS01303]|uniref:hypothetical protein n=1 Tax=Pseudomonas sp. PS01303 TaxID=2991439 RepID=UPI00249B99AC|nr:hypothetical protein [Pseudomonas sp. PS01303]